MSKPENGRPDAPNEPAPSALPVLLENAPSELLVLPQWVCWRYETRNGKATKPPFQTDGARADVSNSSTWNSFDKVSAAYLGGGFDGIGFVVSSGDPLCGVDLDGVRDPATGQLDAHAGAIVAALDSYAEVSPSGRGVRIWATGALPNGARRKGKIEAYDGARFLTFTGHRLDGAPDAINERGDALATFHGEYLAPKPKPQREKAPEPLPVALDDIALLERARGAKNGPKFAALWNGDAGTDASAADASLCSLLAFWTGRDAARVDALFRRSGLMREKWDTRHSADGRTYGEMTVQKAVASCGEIYTGAKAREPLDAQRNSHNGTQPEPGAQRDGDATEEAAPPWAFTTLSELRARPRPLWLIRDVLVEATAVVLSGDSQSFKTFCALDMALCVATGTPWHGREVKRGPVVYIAAEGGWTLRDRLEAWEIARGIEAPKNFHLLEAPVSIGDAATVAAFADFIEATAPRFVVIDTLSACAEGLKENASEDMATFVRHMKAIARATGATVAVIHHNNKGGDLRGAVSLKNDADTHITFERSGEEEELQTVVSCSKHRGAHFPKFALQGERIELPEPDEFGRAVSSLVFSDCDLPEATEREAHPNAKRADKTRARLLELFNELATKHPDGVKIGTWKAQSEADGICSGPTFWRHRGALETAGEIEPNGTSGGSDVYQRGRPTLTTLTTLKTGCESEAQKTVSPTLTTLTIPLGSESCESESKGADLRATRKPKNSPDSEPYGAAPMQPGALETDGEGR